MRIRETSLEVFIYNIYVEKQTSAQMNTPSQDSYNRNDGRGQQQPHRPYHPYKNRRNNFQQNNNFRNNRFNGAGDGSNEMNPTSFVPQGFSSPIVRNGGGGEYFHNHRNNRNGGHGNYRNEAFRNRKNFTPFKVGRLAVAISILCWKCSFI